MDWDIDPRGVASVLKKTEAAAKPLDALTKKYGTCLNDLMQGLNPSAPELGSVQLVAASLSEFAVHWQPSLESSVQQLGASLMGAYNATTAYLNGQEEMAANAQRAAANGQIPPPPGSARRNHGGVRAE
ncbi:DUF6507 family protein [Kribbella sp. NPDC051586]|uniref:DUF6507 family protein n=1 Tax=Kribbella sp. NPDC051586 TaxID=3364118 RepID=UPI00378F68C9